MKNFKAILLKSERLWCSAETVRREEAAAAHKNQKRGTILCAGCAVSVGHPSITMGEPPKGAPRLHASTYVGVVPSTVGTTTRYCAAMHVPSMAPATCDQVAEDREKERSEIFYIGAFNHEISAAVAADVARWGTGPDSCKRTDVPWNFHPLAMCLLSTMSSSFPAALRAVCAGLLADGLIDSLLANGLSRMGLFQLDSAAVRAEFVRYYGESAAEGLRGEMDAVCRAFPADIANAFNANLWPQEAWSAPLSRLAALHGAAPPAEAAPKPPCIRLAVARRAPLAAPTDPSARLVALENGVTLINSDDRYRGVVGRWRAAEQEPALPDDYYAALRLPDGAPAGCDDVARFLTARDGTVELSGPFAYELSAAVEHDAFQLFRNNDIGACNFPALAYHFADAMKRAGAPQFPQGEVGRLMDTVIPSVRQCGCVQLENDVYGLGAWPVEVWAEFLLPPTEAEAEAESESAAMPAPAPRADITGVAYEAAAYSPYAGAAADEDEIEEEVSDDGEAAFGREPWVEEGSSPEEETDTVTFNFTWHCPNVHPADPPVKTLTVLRTFQRSATSACTCRVHSDMCHLFPFATEFAHVRNDVRYRPSRLVESALEDISKAQGNERR